MSQAEAKNVVPMKSIAALNPNVSEADLVQRLGQVQTLLFGDAHTATEDRIAFLEDRVLELESATQDRFDALAEAFDKRTADMETDAHRGDVFACDGQARGEAFENPVCAVQRG